MKIVILTTKEGRFFGKKRVIFRSFEKKSVENFHHLEKCITFALKFFTDAFTPCLVITKCRKTVSLKLHTVRKHY